MFIVHMRKRGWELMWRSRMRSVGFFAMHINVIWISCVKNVIRSQTEVERGGGGAATVFAFILFPNPKRAH